MMTQTALISRAEWGHEHFCLESRRTIPRSYRLSGATPQIPADKRPAHRVLKRLSVRNWGSALIINRAAESRLYAREATPVIMGTTSGAPRTAMQMAAWGKEFLGWNLKWVLGYRGTNELFVALERGEIDMTATSNISLFAGLLAAGKSKILVQSGTTRLGRLSPRAEFADAPLMPMLLQGAIKDPIAAASFAYWLTVHSGPEKWLALRPDTPKAVAYVYRNAFSRTVIDPEFIERSKKAADDFTPISYEDVEVWMKALASTPSPALEFIAEMMRGQGVKID